MKYLQFVKFYKIQEIQIKKLRNRKKIINSISKRNTNIYMLQTVIQTNKLIEIQNHQRRSCPKQSRHLMNFWNLMTLLPKIGTVLIQIKKRIKIIICIKNKKRSFKYWIQMKIQILRQIKSPNLILKMKCAMI